MNELYYRAAVSTKLNLPLFQILSILFFGVVALWQWPDREINHTYITLHLIDVERSKLERVYAERIGEVVHDCLSDEHTLQHKQAQCYGNQNTLNNGRVWTMKIGTGGEEPVLTTKYLEWLPPAWIGESHAGYCIYQGLLPVSSTCVLRKSIKSIDIQ